MSALTEYTLEIYKTDRRTKEGRRRVAVEDFAPVTRDYIESVAAKKRSLGFEVMLFETYVTRQSLDVGYGSNTYRERYDTPYYCSPSSESYWSM